MTSEDKLIKAVNSTGFPLQIGLCHEVEKTTNTHGWKVLGQEHAWKNNLSGSSGFIDVILENSHRNQVLIIECKRVKDTSWIFLQDTEELKNRRHIKAWVSFFNGGAFRSFDWANVTGCPHTPESEFCVIPGHDSTSKPLLERLAASVIDSTEGFAQEEERFYFRKTGEQLRIYYNVIVTTAVLKVCNFDPSNISIESGELSEYNFQEVPYLRFRKQLSFNCELPERDGGASHYELSYAKQNTIFVVNSTHLTDFLREFELDGNALNFLG